jgi:hypothetical protein
MPPSITIWNRLEPRPRSNAIARSLAAPVRDPLWLLARQWQVGEFAAADAGSPVYVDLQAQARALAGWAPGGSASGTPWPGASPPPLEPTVESEPFTPDLATRVELGQWFEALLGVAANAGHLIDDLRTAYPLPLVLDPYVDHLFSFDGHPPGLDRGVVPAELLRAFVANHIPLVPALPIWVVTPGSDWVIADSATGLSYALTTSRAGLEVYLYRDAEALRFLHVCAGRACDGIKILAAVADGIKILPARPEWTPAQIRALAEAGDALAKGVRSMYGAVGVGDPPAWQADRLEFELSVAATAGASTIDVLRATPGPNGEFDWSSFDLAAPGGSLPGVAPGAVTSLNQFVMPGHVRFRGMPNARWWEFETGQTDFGDIQPEKRDLAKLIFMDFMLIHGDDWYLVPLEVPLGTVAEIRGLFVHDVFGATVEVSRADATTAGGGVSPGEQWTMFSPSGAGTPPGVAAYLVVPPSAWPAALAGPVLEEVRFLQDPVADLVWGVEAVAESGVGRPRPGRERDAAGQPAQASPPATAAAGAPLRYRLHSPVPGGWIPFVPAPQPGGQGYVLQRAALPGDTTTAATPVGRILRGTTVREQAVSTEGTVIVRVVCRSRWVDGSTHLWVARRRSLGRGQGSSGLRFDITAVRPEG